MSENVTENNYLELAEHSKQMYEKQDAIIKKQKKHILTLQKHVINSYTFFKVIDELVDDMVEIDEDEAFPQQHPVQIITELARAQYSNIIETMLLQQNS